MSLLLYAVWTALLAWLLVRRGVLSRAAAIALVLLPLVLTGRAMLTGGIYAPIDLAYATEPLASIADDVGITHVANPGVSDVYAQFVPWNLALRRAIAHGEWPLWNPYTALGSPLAGGLQSSPYHPITLLALLIPIEDGITFTAAMAFFLAALSMFLLLRDLELSDIASMFGAAAVMLSNHLVWYAGTALVLAAAAAPLALLGARRIVHAPGKRSAALLGAGLLLIVLAGHPESALHLVTLAIAYFVFEFIRVRPVRWRAVIVSGFAAGLGTLALSAIFLLPFFAAVTQTEENRHRALTFEGRQRTAGAAELAHRIAANAMPFIEGTPGVEESEHERDVVHGWLATAYAGTLLLPLALFALLRVRSPHKWFFGGAALIGIGAGVSAPGFTHLLNLLPGFQFAVNDRMIFYAVIGIATLAAIGIDALSRHPERSEGPPSPMSSFAALRMTPSSLFIAIAAVLLIGAMITDTGLSPTYVRVNVARAVLPLLLGCAALASLKPRHAMLTLIALLLVQRAGELDDMQPTISRKAFYPPFPGLALMRANEPFRIVGVGNTLPPGTSTHYGLEDARAFEAMTLDRYYDLARQWSVEQPVWFNRVDSLDSPLFSLMNVRFAIAPSGYVPPEWWKTKGVFGEYAILENTRVLPRAFARNGTTRVRADGSRLLIHASMRSAGPIVISNAAWKGWRARVDGKETRVGIADRAFLAVNVPAGEHDVVLFYRPVEFVIGAWISGIAALLLIYGWSPSSPITFFMSLQTSFFAAGFRSR